MTINLGLRNPGALTASSPGDTLYIPFASYNDSGDSEALSGLAVSDIEIFKNGDTGGRATDSGISLMSDTGQYSDRVGLYRFSVQLFNTSDDTGFYDAGSQYHVAVDSVTVDGKTVRFFPAVFEVGTPRANLVEVGGDTGAAHLDGGRLGVRGDSGQMAAVLDTGKVASAAWTSHGTRTLTSAHDTGVLLELARVDTGLSETIDRIEDYDTGLRQLVNRFDTGVNSTIDLTLVKLDTGFSNTAVNVTQVNSDTGAAVHLAQMSDEYDTGRLPAEATATLDTGGTKDAVWGTAPGTSTRELTGFAFDTGVQQKLDRIDTGLSETIDRIEDFDTGLRQLISRADTGVRQQTDKLTFDTGANELHADIRKVNNIQIQGAGDTGLANTWRPV